MNLIEALDMVGEEGGLSADGFEDCIIGVAERCGKPPLLVYDQALIVQKLMDRDGMTYEEAREFYEFNIVGAWVGEGTPLFMTRVKAEDNLMDLQEKALTREEIAALSIEQVENLNVRVYDPRVLRKLMTVETSNPGVEKLLDIAAKTGALIIPLKEYAELLGEVGEEGK